MKSKILELLYKYGEMSVLRLAEELIISRQMVHRILAGLLEEGIVEKLGKPPKTYYRISNKRLQPEEKLSLTIADETFLAEHFLVFTDQGSRVEGLDAMEVWCEKQKLPLQKTIDEFILTRKRYLAYKEENGLISGLQKIMNTKGLGNIGLNELYYQDFYAIERFGKTRLGQLIHFAKQGQHKGMMKEIIQTIKPSINYIIKFFGIDAVAFIPPTIKREIQIMKVMEQELKLGLPHLKLVKVKGEITIPQKALSKLDERIQNARSSIMIDDDKTFNKVLIIDDAVGSGATINETALKLKNRGVAKYIIGYAVTGSFKGFDVISEV